MKAFHIFDGCYYTFCKSEFDKKTVRCADSAAKIFDLDPLIIYKEFSVNKRIVETIKSETAESPAADKKMNATLKGGALENFISISKKINKKAITLFLAKNLKEGIPENSILLSRPLRKLLIEEFRAASYLHEKRLI